MSVAPTPPVPFYVDVRLLATTGLGTYQSPWAGWESAVNALPGGDPTGQTIRPAANVHFSAGVYAQTVTINPKMQWVIYGDGIQNSTILFSGTGDAFADIQRINSSVSVFLRYHDLSIYCTNPACTGAGIDDVGGTFVTIERVRMQNFPYGIILDQSELVSISGCIIDSFRIYGVWLLNSDNHTPGARPGFTNQITIQNCQFNAGAEPNVCINDEGGGPHRFVSNNFEGAQMALWASNVVGLTFVGNELEGESTSDPVHFDTRLYSPGFDGVFVGPTQGLVFTGNTLSIGNQNQSLVLNGVIGGRVAENYFAQFTEAAITISGDYNAQIEIVGNTKLISGPFAAAGPFVSAISTSSRRIAAQSYHQLTSTFSKQGLQPGMCTVTPGTMGSYAPEVIAVGAVLLCVNQDGTQLERVTVTAADAATFTATFTLPKATGFLIYGTGSF
jgi:Right handed beta helix region